MFFKTLFKKKFLPAPLLIAFILFCFLLIVSLCRHELWSDEIQAWGLTRDAKSPLELYYNLRYEGNPGLWHAILYPTSRIIRNPDIIKVLNYLVTVTAVFVFLSFSKFRNWQKILFIFGYFVFYEYGTISRHYALTMLLLFTACSIYKYKLEHPHLFSVSLVLLALTSPYGTILSASFLVPTFYEWLLSKKRPGHPLTTIALITILGCALSYTLSLPPSDGSYNKYRRYADIKLAKETVVSVWNSFVPIPNSSDNSWNSNFVKNLNLKFYLSLVLILACLWILRKSKAGVIYFAISLLSLLLFFYLNFSGAVRHQGHIFFAFIVALWISYETNTLNRNRLENVVINSFLFILFTVHVAISSYFFLTDYRKVFYYAGEAAAYINDNGMGNYYLMGDDDLGPIDVAMYLDRPMFISKINEKRNFVLYNLDRKQSGPNAGILLTKALDRYLDGNKNMLLLTTYQLDSTTNPVKLLINYGDGLAIRRSIYIYKYVAELP